VKPLFALLALMTVALPAQARVDGSERAMAAIAPASLSNTASEAPGLGNRIGAILEMRAHMTDRMAPQPKADCTDPQEIARRIEALKALDAFVRMTVNGLIDAAPSNELKAAASEDLAPVLIRHRQDMQANLLQLMELPLVREKAVLAGDVEQLAVQAARP